MPLVIYCHCNSGSRRDSEEALHLLMPAGIRVFALDFAVGAHLPWQSLLFSCPEGIGNFCYLAVCIDMALGNAHPTYASWQGGQPQEQAAVHRQLRT